MLTRRLIPAALAALLAASASPADARPASNHCEPLRLHHRLNTTGFKWTRIRTENMGCRKAHRFIGLHMPRAYDCTWTVTGPTEHDELGPVILKPTYRYTCTRQAPYRQLRFTAPWSEKTG